MQLTILQDQVDFSVVALAGRMDLAGVGAIETRFYATLAPKGKDAIIDLSRTEFLASMGIRMLVTAAKTLERKGARMLLCGPNEIVGQVLVDTGIDQFVPVVPDLDTAIARLKQR